MSDKFTDDDGNPRPSCRCGCTRPHRGGWPARTGPAPALRARHDMAAFTQWSPRWVDHSYRVRCACGAWVYVAEPYDLGDDGLDDLAYLRSCGWDVTVDAWHARHYPGHTVAVMIAAPSTGPRPHTCQPNPYGE